MSKEIRIGIVGNVDSGKSTFVGVYKNSKFDDGRGSARSGVLRCLHEQKSGRTSTITQQYIKIDGSSKKSLVFIDLAGHEKYLKTTLHGLTGYFLDHVFVMIGANMGISRMTREHLSIVMALNIPFSIIITKVDICPKNVYMNTLKNTMKMIKRMSLKRKLTKKSIIIKKNDNIQEIINNIEKDNIKEDNIKKGNYTENIFIFSISNKTGINFNLVKDYCNILIKRYENKKTKHKCSKLFIVDNKYNVPGVGIVIAGKMFSGCIKKNEQLYIGPFDGSWYKISTKSFHDNFRNNIDMLNEYEAGTIAIKFTKLNKDLIKKLIFKRGVYVIGFSDLEKIQYKTFDAEVKVLINHSTTIKENYQPIINCNKIIQAAKIDKIYDKDILRAGDTSKIKLTFNFRSEFIQLDDIFIFREGKTKGIGRVIKLYK